VVGSLLASAPDAVVGIAALGDTVVPTTVLDATVLAAAVLDGAAVDDRAGAAVDADVAEPPVGDVLGAVVGSTTDLPLLLQATATNTTAMSKEP